MGQDAARLVGLDRDCGVLAIDDLDALLALEPDCVVYAPLHPDVAELSRLLHAGVNVSAARS